MLVDTGMHERGSLQNLELALDRTGHRLRDVQLVVITHAHVDHCGQAPVIAERAGCEVWMHPAWQLHARSPTSTARSRSRSSPACPRSRCGASPSAAASAGTRPGGRAALRPRPAPRRDDRDRRGRLAGGRDARPRALARLPAPARAAAADLRRPPARPRLAVLRRRLHARPGRRVPALARHGRSARRAARAGRPRAAVHGHRAATSRATASWSPSAWRRSGPRWRTAR